MKSALTLKRISRDLRGSNGVVYLMFLGRETSVSRIREPTKVIFPGGHVENVNQAFKRLKDKDTYLRFIKLEETTPRKPGRKPEIYKADYEPLFITLRELKIEFEEKWLKNLVENLAVLNDYFPSFLVSMEKYTSPEFSTKTLTWERTLSGYFFFLCIKLKFSKEKETIDIDAEGIDMLPPPLQVFLKTIFSLQFHKEKPLDLEVKERVEEIFNQNPEARAKFLKMALSIGLRSLGPIGQGFLALMEGALTESYS